MKRTIYLLVGMLVLFTGCKNYDDDIARIDNVLEQMKNSSITSIEQQITHISTSLADLKKVDAELEALILSLEGGDAEHSEFLKALQAKDAELDRKIADLQAYLDGEIKTTEDWATATFATLEQYADMQKEIASLKSLINGIDTGISVGQLNAAISSSETSMKTWVNSVLADGYYDIATIDAKLDAIRASISYYDDTELRKAIEAQQTALAQAKSSITASYKKAISDAITENNGNISAEIAAAVKTAQDNLQAQIDAINSEIEKIKARLDIIEADINSINQQIAAINGSIDDLKGVDAKLKGYIESLQNTANDWQSKIDATNAALTALESDLEGQITASEQKVLDELNTVKTALEGQLATINNTITSLTSQLTAIEGKIASLEEAVAACATPEDVNEVKQNLATVQSDMEAMKTAITALQGRMDTVEGEVDSLQTDVADLKSRIENLEELFDQIQSVTFIPQYTDGKVKLDYTTHTTSLDFMINPNRLNGTLAEAWKDNNEVIRAYVRYTNDPTTRAVAAPIELTVSTVTASDGGMINITVKDNDPSLLSENFWDGRLEAVIYIVITNGKTEIASEAVPMIAHSYAGNTNAIDGFGDGGSQNGEASE